jgi:hypothetical protein
MVELLVAVVALQYLALAKPVQADAVWLAGANAVAAPAPATRSEGSDGGAAQQNAR